MDDGWIKIHKSIWRNPWMHHPNVLTVWVYILCHVEWRPTDVVFEGQRITLQPGQGLFKLRGIATELRIPRSSLFRVIDVLKSEKQIETQTSPRNTLVTVVNWKKYQLAGTQNGTQMGHKRDTSGTQNGFLPITNKKQEREEAKLPRVANQNSDEVNEAIRFFAEQIAPVPGDAIRPFDLLVKCYGLDAFKAAVQIMKRRGGHSLRYLEMILKDPRTMAAAGDDLPEEVIRHVLS